MNDKERVAILVSLWLQRPLNKRTPDDIGIFYREVDRDHPELLTRTDDPYQRLTRDLHGHILEPQAGRKQKGRS